MSARPNAVLCVGAAVRRDDRVLLVRQAAGHALAGQWSIPWGFVDPGESPRDAAVRETLEEAGVHVEVEGIVGVQVLPEPSWLGLVLLCRHVSGEPRGDGREVDVAGFFGADQLRALGGDIEPWCAWVVARVMAEQHRLMPLADGHPYLPHDGFF
jgi:ADP-ribose pyrophosphatase YjhB (NUDIX family)